MPHEGAMAVTSETAGKVDSSGNYIYDLGNMVTIDLPNGAGALTVGEYSTENKLYQFLSDAKATIDTVKGNWFEFTNVRFLTGGSKVDSISSVQLKNIVALSKGFPAASFKVGGYTDNTGDSAANVTLSQKRSEAVVAELKKLGALSTAITGAKGYGPAFPIGDNATAEGRAMNRRVAINVKSK
jgi:outer membrane protein OmpA-like peptidoglycan-associated protein